jgi:hypothetical protein
MMALLHWMPVTVATAPWFVRLILLGAPSFRKGTMDIWKQCHLQHISKTCHVDSQTVTFKGLQMIVLGVKKLPAFNIGTFSYIRHWFSSTGTY